MNKTYDELLQEVQALRGQLEESERREHELAAKIEQAQRLADKDRVDDEFYDEYGDLRTGSGWKSKLGRDLHAALKLPPAASLAAHDAALLRRHGELAAASIEDGELLDSFKVFDLFCERANRIERGES